MRKSVQFYTVRRKPFAWLARFVYSVENSLPDITKIIQLADLLTVRKSEVTTTIHVNSVNAECRNIFVLNHLSEDVNTVHLQGERTQANFLLE